MREETESKVTEKSKRVNERGIAPCLAYTNGNSLSYWQLWDDWNLFHTHPSVSQARIHSHEWSAREPPHRIIHCLHNHLPLACLCRHSESWPLTLLTDSFCIRKIHSRLQCNWTNQKYLLSVLVLKTLASFFKLEIKHECFLFSEVCCTRTLIQNTVYRLWWVLLLSILFCVILVAYMITWTTIGAWNDPF